MASGQFVSYLEGFDRPAGNQRSWPGSTAESRSPATSTGGRWDLVKEVVEVDSSKRNDRPAIAEALRLCRLHRATPHHCQTLDRLARNVHFISSLMESGVEFIAVDFPHANQSDGVHILAPSPSTRPP